MSKDKSNPKIQESSKPNIRPHLNDRVLAMLKDEKEKRAYMDYAVFSLS